MSKKITGILFFLFFSVVVMGQQTKSSFYITGKIKLDQGYVDQLNIKVYRNGGLLNTLLVNNTGNFRVGLDLNCVYRYVIENDAYYSKIIEVDTHVPKEVCNDNCSFPPYQLSILLYKKVPGVNETETPIGKISYNPKIDNFDAELLRDNTDLKLEITKAMAEVKAQSQKYESETAKIKKERYNKAIADADILAQQKNYSQAMQLYRDAVLMAPDIQYPRNRVAQLYQLLIAEQLVQSFGEIAENNFLTYVNYGDAKFKDREYSMAKVAFEKAMQLKPSDVSLQTKLNNAAAELNNMNELANAEVNQRKAAYASRTARYNELIAKGDAQFGKEELALAKDYYSQAATQIDENSYSILMIKKIDELLGSDEAALKLAAEREEAEKKRLKDARNKAYADAIKEADNLFQQRLYRDAIENYELALTIKSFEQYPQQQIRTIKDILAKLQLQGEEYNRYLREADALFSEKKYSEARAGYVKAHDLIPSEKYAAQRVVEIDELLARSKDEENIQQKYDVIINEAEQLASLKKYADAITKYQQASILKPNEQLPKNKIKELRDILSRESNEQKRAMQIQNDFDKAIAMADDAFNRQSYAAARSLYQEALQIVPGQEYPISQIRKIDSILKEKIDLSKEKSVLDQIDFSKLDGISEDLRKAAYDEAMRLGNSFVTTNEWGLARFYFRRALSLYPKDVPAQQKLTMVDAKIRGGNVDEAKFNEMMSKADEAFKTGDFGVAKFYYNKAREIKSDNEFLNERIQIVNRLAETTASRNANDEFNNAINKGDEALNSKNYSVARFFYRKALSLKPNDESAKQKLAQVESLLK